MATDGALRIGEAVALAVRHLVRHGPSGRRYRVRGHRRFAALVQRLGLGRGRERESHSASSGMVVEVLDDDWRRYVCNDIGLDPDFSKLVFPLSIS